MNSQYSKILAKGNILAKNFGKIQHIQKNNNSELWAVFLSSRIINSCWCFLFECSLDEESRFSLWNHLSTRRERNHQNTASLFVGFGDQLFIFTHCSLGLPLTLGYKHGGHFNLILVSRITFREWSYIISE